ncbi:hypothetical protein H2203_005991 [Taxawa tesnikishii (nom. ined.)]|nr:hypothetical protein H2203_005991 [Dothideales sp. JES 119]
MAFMTAAAPPEEPQTYFYIGQHESARDTPVSSILLGQAQGAGYDMMTSPISTPAYRVKVQELVDDYLLTVLEDESVDAESVPMPLVPPLTPEYTTLTPDETISSLLMTTSPWIDLASSDPAIAHVSRQVFNQEVAYAAFCGVNNIMVPALGTGPYVQLQIVMPMSQDIKEGKPEDPQHFVHKARVDYREDGDGVNPVSEAYGSWDAWDLIRSTCRYHGRLSVSVTIPRQLPPFDVQSRWFSEPLRAIIFPETSFVRNQKGYPVLPKSTQALITRFMRLRTPPWILLSDVGPIPGEEQMLASLSNSTSNAAFSSASSMSSARSPSPAPTPAEAAQSSRLPKKKDPAPHLSYIRHLQQTQSPRSMIERFATGYQDYLQSPLQPLTDNLESITTGVPVSAWAVEKNPNAYVLLQHHNETDPLWNRSVQVIKSDMRFWAGPLTPSGSEGKVDILVSELLGSFADNELSPECLDGVQHVLHPQHGISIPTSYTAHLTPISSPRIYADILSRGGSDDRWELPYVVMLHQYDYLSFDPLAPSSIPDIQQTWEFTHPLAPGILAQSQLRRGGSAAGGGGGAVGGDGANEHNARFSRTRFRCARRGTCHGLAGYFETVLYESRSGRQVELSTNPVTMEDKSQDMISWFPIFFPLQTPLYIPDDAELDVSMWRQTDDRKVWYEWMVEVYCYVNGKRIRLGASDLHSSWKNGCLM